MQVMETMDSSGLQEDMLDLYLMLHFSKPLSVPLQSTLSVIFLSVFTSP